MRLLVQRLCKRPLLAMCICALLVLWVCTTPALAGDFDVNPTAVAFGTVTVGSAATRTVTVPNNHTSATYRIGDISLSNTDAFASVNDGCSRSNLPPGQSCTFDLEFRPAAEESASCLVSVPSDYQAQPTVTIEVTGKGVPGCVTSVAPLSEVAQLSGAAGTIHLTAPDTCTWSATSDSPWLTITSGAAGTGSADIAYSAAINTGDAPRTGNITVGSETFVVFQKGISMCGFSISPGSSLTDMNASSGTITVTTAAECSWTATPSDSWISISSGTTGTGPGAVQYAAEATGVGRVGTIRIGVPGASAIFTVHQGKPANAFTLYKGWNMIGYGKGNTKSMVSALQGIANQVALVWSFENGQWLYYYPDQPDISTLTSIVPGRGYWIKMKQNMQWSMP
jgi:hypothetical protein